MRITRKLWCTKCHTLFTEAVLLEWQKCLFTDCDGTLRSVPPPERLDGATAAHGSRHRAPVARSLGAEIMKPLKGVVRGADGQLWRGGRATGPIS